MVWSRPPLLLYSQLWGRANWFVIPFVWLIRGECCIRTCATLVLASLLLNLYSLCQFKIIVCIVSLGHCVCVCVSVCVCVCVCVCVWERERERESAFLFWLAALVLWHLFMGRCLCSYMIFLIKYLFAVVVIVDCQSTVGVPKCLE